MKAFKPAAGFTLIELLVVIAIIAILAALLFPVFRSVQDQGQRSHVHREPRQISISAEGRIRLTTTPTPRPPRYDGTRYQGGISALYPDYIQR